MDVRTAEQWFKTFLTGIIGALALASLGSPGFAATEQAPIKLPGRIASAAPEVWERTAAGPPSPGVASASGSELSVRNVSQPTLQPFLPDVPTGAAMIVVPGGGFMTVTIEREGYSVAKWLNERGIAAFVLKYRVVQTSADARQASIQLANIVKESMQRIRTGGSTVSELLSEEQRKAMLAAQEDGLEAVRYVRASASKWGLSPDRIGIVGFSAGAVTVLNVVLKADAASRPDLVASLYGMPPSTAAIPTTAPPAFIAVAADDAAVSGSLAIYNAWRATGRIAELHILENGGHGFGMLHQGKSSDHWPQLFDYWLSAHGFETKAH
jgi:acetyl esterase/lipase